MSVFRRTLTWSAWLHNYCGLHRPHGILSDLQYHRTYLNILCCILLQCTYLPSEQWTLGRGEWIVKIKQKGYIHTRRAIIWEMQRLWMAASTLSAKSTGYYALRFKYNVNDLPQVHSNPHHSSKHVNVSFWLWHCAWWEKAGMQCKAQTQDKCKA